MNKSVRRRIPPYPQPQIERETRRKADSAGRAVADLVHMAPGCRLVSLDSYQPRMLLLPTLGRMVPGSVGAWAALE